MNDRWLGWHFLREDGRTGYGGRKPVPGTLMRCKGELELCANGLHASQRAIDALRYAPGPVVQRVELIGERVDSYDKSCANARRCLWIADASRTLHEFALWCRERAISQEWRAGYKPDSRLIEALAVERRWLNGQATDEGLCARFSSSWAAEKSATWSAMWSAAKEAGSSVARYASMYVEMEAARDAAWAATWEVHNAELHDRLMALAPEGYMEISDD